MVMISGFTAVADTMGGVFEEILGIRGVKGIIIFTRDGQVAFKYFVGPHSFDPEEKDWWALYIYTLEGIREAELVFQHDRLYIRKAKEGYLFVLVSNEAPMPIIRLNCDILLSADREGGNKKGLIGFFKYRKRLDKKKEVTK